MDRLDAFRGRRGVLLDLDGTLYCGRHHLGYLAEVDRVTGLRVAPHYGGVTPEAAFRLLQRDQDAAGCRSKSEALERLFGIGLAEMNRWRERWTRPEHHLRPDPLLLEALRALAGRFELVLGTNNAPGLTRSILEILGVPEGTFRALITSEDVGAAKPEAGFFRAAAAAVRCTPGEMVSVGDRPEADLEPAARLGMGTYLVQSIEDMYALRKAAP